MRFLISSRSAAGSNGYHQRENKLFSIGKDGGEEKIHVLEVRHAQLSAGGVVHSFPVEKDVVRRPVHDMPGL